MDPPRVSQVAEASQHQDYHGLFHAAKIPVICNEDFAYEGPRYKKLGPESGEEFRDKYFIPWLEKNKDMDNLIIDFDGTIVYTPSFLEETFGGAIRKGYVQVEKLTFINLPDEQRNDIYKYIKDALVEKEQWKLK